MKLFYNIFSIINSILYVPLGFAVYGITAFSVYKFITTIDFYWLVLLIGTLPFTVYTIIQSFAAFLDKRIYLYGIILLPFSALVYYIVVYFFYYSDETYYQFIISIVNFFVILYLLVIATRQNINVDNKSIAINKTLPVFPLITKQSKVHVFENLQMEYKFYFFFRGNWCPTSIGYINYIKKNFQKMEKAQYIVYFY